MPDITTTPCEICAGACCRELAVTVSIIDAARLVRALHIPVYDLLARYVDEDPEEAPYVFHIRRQPIALALMPPAGRDRGCSFLMLVGQHARCGIYDIRPGTCRVYPFSRERGQVHHKRDSLCPHRFKLADSQPAIIHCSIDEYQRDWDRHAQFCAEWNEAPPPYPSFDKLLDYVDELIATGRV